MPSNGIEFEYAWRSDQGAREYQEDYADLSVLKSGSSDATEARPAAGALLTVLADGMGGHVGGALASQTACREFISNFRQAMSRQENSRDANRESLSFALERSNGAIADVVHKNPDLNGMGCTLLAARIDRRGILWNSVGDSLLILVRNGRARRINADHSMAPVLDGMAQNGELSVEEAQKHPQRNALRSALLGRKVELVEEREEFLPLKPRDWVLLASDGLLTLELSQIEQIVSRLEPHGARRVVDGLIAAVMNNGLAFQDNTTVIAVGAFDAGRPIDRRFVPSSTDARKAAAAAAPVRSAARASAGTAKASSSPRAATGLAPGMAVAGGIAVVAGVTGLVFAVIAGVQSVSDLSSRLPAAATDLIETGIEKGKDTVRRIKEATGSGGDEDRTTETEEQRAKDKTNKENDEEAAEEEKESEPAKIIDKVKKKAEEVGGELKEKIGRAAEKFLNKGGSDN